MGASDWIGLLSIAVVVLGAFIGLTLRNNSAMIALKKDVEFSHSRHDELRQAFDGRYDDLKRSLEKDDGRIEDAMSQLRRAIEDYSGRQEGAWGYFGTIAANQQSQIDGLEYRVGYVETATGHKSNRRMPALQALPPAPPFLPASARVPTRQEGTENTGRYAAYTPQQPPRPKK